MKKVGIYSGTFDPVHEGHIAFAREAIAHAKLDKVFFLVEPRPRRKQGVKAFEHRVAMLRLAIEEEPKLGSIVLEHSRFSVSETLPVLQARFKDAQLYFLVGDDMLNHFNDHDWPGINRFVKAVSLVIGLRQQQPKRVIEMIGVLEKTRAIKVTYQLFQASLPEFSSRDIRAALRKGLKPPAVPKKVMAYIKRHGLYTLELDS